METGKQERNLLLISGLITGSGILTVSFLAKGSLDYATGGIVAGIWMAFLLVHLFLRTTGHNGDPVLLPVASVLTGLGLTLLLRLNSDLFFLQALWLVVGLAGFLGTVVLFQNPGRFAGYKYVLGGIGLILLLSTILFGVDIGGHRSWIIVGPIRFQPSEFAKLFVILFLAAYLSERREVIAFATRRYGPLVLPQPRFIAPLMAVWMLAMVMLVAQRDLGSALLYFGITVIMTYMASGRFTYIALGAFLFLSGSILCYFLYSHVQVRVDIWLDPWKDPNGKAYQIVQSLFALGSGGILGTGLTYGYPKMIPEVHTDFIFAVIGEELGFVGSAAVMLIYLLFIYRAFRIAMKAVNPFSTLVASGLAVFLALQVFLIVGGVTKFFPLTGITLPWVSYGGSSMVANFILLGMLYAISEVRRNHEK